jgi:hypothetical protein
MEAVRVHRAHCRRLLVLLASCAAVSACVTSDDPASGSVVALFRAPVHPISEAVAPRFQTAWYAAREPVSYAKVGVARWADRPSEWRFGAWVSHLFAGRSAAPRPPVALAALDSGLPVPSLVNVTDMATYRTITVRVDQKAELNGDLIELPRELAQAFGAGPHRPLLVRVRYQAPVLAYREPPTLGQAVALALRGPAGAPGVELAAGAAPEAAPAPPAIAAAPAASVPERPAASSAAPARLTLAALRPELPPPRPGAPPRRVLAPARPFVIEAGAFASLANARRAVSLLAPTGEASIIPARSHGLILYRVVLAGPTTPDAAEALRARIAPLGFADARILRPGPWPDSERPPVVGAAFP